MKTNEEYFGTNTSPIKAEDVRRETGLPAQHAQQQRRTIIPVVALGAVFTLMFIGMFSLGFYVGRQTADTNTGKQSGQVFEKPASVGKLMTEPFEKRVSAVRAETPEELL